MIDGWNIFDKEVKTKLRTKDNIGKIVTAQGNYYTIDCLLGYPYFKNDHRIIAIDLSK